MKISRNLLFFLFLPTFIILYVAGNSHNTVLGTVGIGLTVANALAVLVMKK